MSASFLYDMPVSNNGARCRIIVYKKNLSLTDDVVIKKVCSCMVCVCVVRAW